MAVPARSPETEQDDESIELMTREEGLRLLDRKARKYLGMSGVEFIARYNAGEIEDPRHLDVARVAILLPLTELWACLAELLMTHGFDTRSPGKRRSGASLLGALSCGDQPLVFVPIHPIP